MNEKAGAPTRARSFQDSEKSRLNQLFRLVRWSTSPVRASSAAWVESSEVIPRPITRRPLDEPEPEEEDPDALRVLVERDEPEALLPLLLPLPLLLEPLLALRDPLLELFPPLALIPLLLRFGMLTLA